MDVRVQKRLGSIVEASQRQDFRPDEKLWLQLLCFTAALLASGGLWIGLLLSPDVCSPADSKGSAWGSTPKFNQFRP